MRRLFFDSRLPVPVVLALLLISTGWAQAQPDAPNCYILSAGVDDYQQANDLKGCVADARNTVAAFQAQQGRLFGNVQASILLNRDATHARILQGMQALAQTGSSGDFVVVFLSGHGARANNNQSWFFLPHDYSPQNPATALTDRQILDSADALVRQGKKVFVIVDACFAGQLNVSARSYFAKYRNSQAGGLVIMASSGAEQTSAALGQYSAFAKAFADAMNAGDLNQDGKITLSEIHAYSSKRTQSLIKHHGQSSKQDSEMAWSPSMSEHMPLALTQQVAMKTPTKPQLPIVVKPTPQPQAAPLNAQVWSGSESLAGFGRLSFQLFGGGRAVMHDAAGASEGTWSQSGNVVTLRFANGRVVYTGALRGQSIIGEARSDRSVWTFSVSQQG